MNAQYLKSYQNHSLESFFSTNLSATDDAVFTGIQAEFVRQNEQIELIASENIVSKAVMQAQGTCLTNKYAEGYPNRRYYGGCEHVDTVEAIAIERAKTLFKCEYANVQPHSGAQANGAVKLAFYSRVTPLWVCRLMQVDT